MPAPPHLDTLSNWIKDQDDEAIRKAVVELVELISKPARTARDEILAALKQKQAPVSPVLLDLMSQELLAIPAATAACLKHCLQSHLDFDPFADAEARNSQLKTFRTLLSQKSG